MGCGRLGVVESKMAYLSQTTRTQFLGSGAISSLTHLKQVLGLSKEKYLYSNVPPLLTLVDDSRRLFKTIAYLFCSKPCMALPTVLTERCVFLEINSFVGTKSGEQETRYAHTFNSLFFSPGLHSAADIQEHSLLFS